MAPQNFRVFEHPLALRTYAGSTVPEAMSRTPLGPYNQRAVMPLSSDSKTTGKMRAEPDDELLGKAVAANPFSMAELGQPPRSAKNGAVPGAAALRAWALP